MKDVKTQHVKYLYLSEYGEILGEYTEVYPDAIVDCYRRDYDGAIFPILLPKGIQFLMIE